MAVVPGSPAATGGGSPTVRGRRARTAEGEEPGSGRTWRLLLIGGVAGLALMAVFILLDQHSRHPRPGDVVAFEGGTFTVPGSVDVDLSAPMTGPGMAMGPSSGVPEIPDGMRQVSVEYSLQADPARGYVVDPARFTVSADGAGRVVPSSVDDGATVIPPGASLDRTFDYQVPEEAVSLEVWAPGAADPVMLDLGEAPEPHGH